MHSENPAVPRKINILFAIDYFHRTGGTEKHLAQLVRLLPRESFTARVVVFDLGENALVDDMRTSGVPVYDLPVGRIYTPHAFRQAMKLAKIIKRDKIDIVQTFHQTSDTLAALTAKMAGVKWIVSSKRDTGQLKRPLHVFINRRLKFLFDRTIVVANAVGDAIVATEGIARSRITRIYNGVDAIKFSPPTAIESVAARKSLGFGDEDFVVGMVAVFRPEKNHGVFFEGALKAMAAIPSLKLLVVGAGPLFEHCRALYDTEHLRTRINFAGETTDVTPYLKAMDVGCLIPGKNEGFSNSVLEKMAFGLPMIVSDVGGNAEAVIDGENGIVIPPNDSDAFCAALIRMHSDSRARLAMGLRSRQLVEEEYSLMEMCRNHEALYQSLCA